MNAFASSDSSLQSFLRLVLLVAPALIGMFWGAPLIAREFETGTFRLAWTQDVTPTRWLASRYWAFQWYETAIFLGLAVILAGACFWQIRRRRSEELHILHPHANRKTPARQVWVIRTNQANKAMKSTNGPSASSSLPPRPGRSRIPWSLIIDSSAQPTAGKTPAATAQPLLAARCAGPLAGSSPPASSADRPLRQPGRS